MYLLLLVVVVALMMMMMISEKVRLVSCLGFEKLTYSLCWHHLG